tara:strand:+ start:120 stop:536 length:417 start_codon:yes stop_codon:yes gene_type:complete
MATQRAFAWLEGSVPASGFSENANLIWETSIGSAGVSLAPDGPGGNVYWPGPDETTGQKGVYMIAYANNGSPTHTGANSVASHIQFWGSDTLSEFLDIATNISNQGYADLDPATFEDVSEVLSAFNNVDNWQAFNNAV